MKSSFNEPSNTNEERSNSVAKQNRSTKIQNRLKSDYDRLVGLGYEVVCVFLQGSQNYLLDTELSDIDTKAIVLQGFDQFVIGAPAVSKTIMIESNQQIDIKDIRIMFDVLTKSNVNYLEILFTQHRIENPSYSEMLRPIFENAQRLALWNKKALINSIAGMAQQKYIALKHPYPSLIDKIEKFGYDPKQLHHILRLYEFLQRLLGGEPFGDCFISKNAEYLIAVKYGQYPLNDAESLAKEYCKKINDLKNMALTTFASENDTAALDIYADVRLALLKKWFKQQLLS